MNREHFTPVYLDSENYYKQGANQSEQRNINTFSPSEQSKVGKIQTGYNTCNRLENGKTTTRTGIHLFTFHHQSHETSCSALF